MQCLHLTRPACKNQFPHPLAHDKKMVLATVSNHESTEALQHPMVNVLSCTMASNISHIHAQELPLANPMVTQCQMGSRSRLPLDRNLPAVNGPFIYTPPKRPMM